MRKNFLVLFLALTLNSAMALDNDDVHLLDKEMGGVAAKVQLGSKIKKRTLQVLRVVYDAQLGGRNRVASSGGWGASNASTVLPATSLRGSHVLGYSLPAQTLVTKSWFQVITPFVDSGSAGARLEVFCGERNNIVHSTLHNVKSWPARAVVPGIHNNTLDVTSVHRIATACEVKGVVHVKDFDAGKAVIFVEHVVSE